MHNIICNIHIWNHTYVCSYTHTRNVYINITHMHICITLKEIEGKSMERKENMSMQTRTDTVIMIEHHIYPELLGNQCVGEMELLLV